MSKRDYVSTYLVGPPAQFAERAAPRGRSAWLHEGVISQLFNSVLHSEALVACAASLLFQMTECMYSIEPLKRWLMSHQTGCWLRMWMDTLEMLDVAVESRLIDVGLLFGSLLSG